MIYGWRKGGAGGRFAAVKFTGAAEGGAAAPSAPCIYYCRRHSARASANDRANISSHVMQRDELIGLWTLEIEQTVTYETGLF
jgi:hypothetical protein